MATETARMRATIMTTEVDFTGSMLRRVEPDTAIAAASASTAHVAAPNEDEESSKHARRRRTLSALLHNGAVLSHRAGRHRAALGRYVESLRILRGQLRSELDAAEAGGSNGGSNGNNSNDSSDEVTRTRELLRQCEAVVAEEERTELNAAKQYGYVDEGQVAGRVDLYPRKSAMAREDDDAVTPGPSSQEDEHEFMSRKIPARVELRDSSYAKIATSASQQQGFANISTTAAAAADHHRDNQEEDASRTASTLYGMALCHIEFRDFDKAVGFLGMADEAMMTSTTTSASGAETMTATSSMDSANLAADVKHTLAHTLHLMGGHTDQASAAIEASLTLRTAATRAHRAKVTGERSQHLASAVAMTMMSEQDKITQARLTESTVDSVSLMGRLYYASGEFSSALQCLEEVLKLRLDLHGPGSLPVLTTECSIGHVLHADAMTVTPAGGVAAAPLYYGGVGGGAPRDGFPAWNSRWAAERLSALSRHPVLVALPRLLAPFRAEALFALGDVLLDLAASSPAASALAPGGQLILQQQPQPQYSPSPHQHYHTAKAIEALRAGIDVAHSHRLASSSSGGGNGGNILTPPPSLALDLAPLLRLAFACRSAGDYRSALAAAAHALDLHGTFEQQGPEDQESNKEEKERREDVLASILSSVAQSHHGMGRPLDALEAYKCALHALAASATGDDNDINGGGSLARQQRRARLLGSMGDLHLEMGDASSAIECCDLASRSLSEEQVEEEAEEEEGAQQDEDDDDMDDDDEHDDEDFLSQECFSFLRNLHAAAA